MFMMQIHLWIIGLADRETFRRVGKDMFEMDYDVSTAQIKLNVKLLVFWKFCNFNV